MEWILIPQFMQEEENDYYTLILLFLCPLLIYIETLSYYDGNTTDEEPESGTEYEINRCVGLF